MSKKNKEKKEQKSIFCAYADGQKDFVECLQQAKNILNKYTKTQQYKLNLWEKMNTNGKFIIENIKREIKESDYFICELSTFNWNVFFELGYAIGCEKPVKLFLKDDQSIKKEFKNLRFLSNCGYKAYKSKEEIRQALMEGFDSNDTSALKEFGKQCKPDSDSSIKDQILIIANTIEEQSILEIQQKLNRDEIQYQYNNNKEAGYKPKEWYKKNISQSYGVIIYLSFKNENKEKRENAENSFIAGICDAIDKPYMFIGHESLKPGPIDYNDHFMAYGKEIEVKDIVDTFINNNRTSFIIDKEVERKKSVNEQIDNINKIKPYFNFIAEEEESGKLFDYFIENKFHQEALGNQGIKIIVGRKGTGKTALFLKLKKDLPSHTNSITAILNPDKSDFRANIELINSYKQQKEKILSTIWEIVILSTLCREIKEIKEKKIYDNGFNNNVLIQTLEKHENIGFFKILQEYKEYKEYKHVLEIHKDQSYLSMRAEFYDYIKSKKYLTINIVADNLDCIWDEGIERGVQSSIIKSLFDFATEFRNRLQTYNKNIKINFCFFLREDIFIKIKETEKFEIDKFEGKKIKMDWSSCKNDLQNIVNKRVANALGIDSPEDIEKVWVKYFRLTGKEAFNKILLKHNIIPRPRDLLKYLSDLFLSSEDGTINSNDFDEANKEYRAFIYDNMKLEISSIFDQSNTVFDKITKKFDRIYEAMEGHDFIKTIKDEFTDKENMFEFLKNLIELDYLTCIVNNKYYKEIEEIKDKFSEKKLFFFRKNKIRFRFKQPQ